MATIYVADTHALIWYLQGSPLLGFSARNAFDRAVTGQAHVLIPTIVLAEHTISLSGLVPVLW